MFIIPILYISLLPAQLNTATCTNSQYSGNMASSCRRKYPFNIAQNVINIRRPHNEKVKIYPTHIKSISVYLENDQSHSQQSTVFQTSTVDNLCCILMINSCSTGTEMQDTLYTILLILTKFQKFHKVYWIQLRSEAS